MDCQVNITNLVLTIMMVKLKLQFRSFLSISTIWILRKGRKSSLLKGMMPLSFILRRTSRYRYQIQNVRWCNRIMEAQVNKCSAADLCLSANKNKGAEQSWVKILMNMVQTPTSVIINALNSARMISNQTLRSPSILTSSNYNQKHKMFGSQYKVPKKTPRAKPYPRPKTISICASQM